MCVWGGWRGAGKEINSKTGRGGGGGGEEFQHSLKNLDLSKNLHFLHFGIVLEDNVLDVSWI